MKLELMNATNFNNNAKHIDFCDLKISKKNSHNKSVLVNDNKEDSKKIYNQSHKSNKLLSNTLENLNNFKNLFEHSVYVKKNKKKNNPNYLKLQKKKSQKIPNNKSKTRFISDTNLTNFQKMLKKINKMDSIQNHNQSQHNNDKNNSFLIGDSGVSSKKKSKKLKVESFKNVYYDNIYINKTPVSKRKKFNLKQKESLKNFKENTNIENETNDINKMINNNLMINNNNSINNNNIIIYNNKNNEKNNKDNNLITNSNNNNNLDNNQILTNKNLNLITIEKKENNQNIEIKKKKKFFLCCF